MPVHTKAQRARSHEGVHAEARRTDGAAEGSFFVSGIPTVRVTAGISMTGRDPIRVAPLQPGSATSRSTQPNRERGTKHRRRDGARLLPADAVRVYSQGSGALRVRGTRSHSMVAGLGRATVPAAFPD